MRKLLLLLPFLIPMCGFTQAPYDVSAVTKAGTARKQALETCGARTDFKSSAEVIDCVVVADNNFAHAVHLSDPKLFEDYATGVKALDANIVAGTLKPDDIGKNFRALQDAFFKGMRERYADYQASLAEDLKSANDEARTTTGMNSGMSMMDNMNGMPGMGK